MVGRKRSANSGVNGTPGAKKKKPKMEDYVLPCKVDDCAHVVVSVGTPAVKFTLCKNRIQHESDYFAAALNNNSKFKEGQNLTIRLKDTCPELFLLYIKTIFPNCAEDSEALPMFLLAPEGETVKPTLTCNLIGLFECIDRFGSISCANVQRRVVKSLRLMGETTTTPTNYWPPLDQMQFVANFSKYNMDQSREILDELLKMDLVMSDAKFMNDIKPIILHPIVERDRAKLLCQMNLLQRTLASDAVVELYCEKCDYVIPLREVEAMTTPNIYCPTCWDYDVIVRENTGVIYDPVPETELLETRESRIAAVYAFCCKAMSPLLSLFKSG